MLITLQKQSIPRTVLMCMHLGTSIWSLQPYRVASPEVQHHRPREVVPGAIDVLVKRYFVVQHEVQIGRGGSCRLVHGPGKQISSGYLAGKCPRFPVVGPTIVHQHVTEYEFSVLHCGVLARQ